MMSSTEYCFLVVVFLNKYHYALVSQTDGCNMTFTADILFPISFMHWFDQNQAPTGVRTQVHSMRGGRFTN